MSAGAIVWLVAVVALVVVLALAGAQASQALRELKRLERRVEAYGELEVVRAAERSTRSASRLAASRDAITPLVERAEAALAVIRQGPLPPEFTSVVARIYAELVAFRAAR